jgi:AraC-like DNA-binding protein
LADILLLQPDSRASATLSSALEPRYSVEGVRNWREVERRLKKGEPRGCVLDLLDAKPPFTLTTLRRIRRTHHSVALVIASDFRGREMELYHLGRVSVDGVLRLEEEPTAREIRAVVDRALTSSLAEMVVQITARDLPPLIQEALRWVIENAEARPQVTALAAALAVTPRALLKETDALELTPPRDLLLWGRLIRASHLLEHSHETVESVAFQLGYATGGALRKALKRHVGCSPTTLLRRGGLAWTLKVFQRDGLRRSPDA